MTRSSSNRVGRLAGRAVLVSVALAGGLGAHLGAQTADRASDRGWIGVSFDLTADREGRGAVFRIVDVSPGSPAEAAGLRRGDHVLAVNDLDRADELATLTERLRLRVGDPVVIEIERQGRRHRLRLEAAAVPADFTVGRTMRLAVESDAMVETWVRAMDSLRTELIARGEEYARRRAEGVGEGAVGEDGDGREIRLRRVAGEVSGRTSIAGGGSEGTRRAPFEFFVFHGSEHDSLRYELAALEHAALDLRERIGARERQLTSGAPNIASERLEADRELQRLRQALGTVSARSAALEAAVAEAARTTAGFGYSLAPTSRGARATDARAATEGRPPTQGRPTTSAPAPIEARPPTETRAPGEAPGFSPLTPYVLGRNRVAGAEVIDLRPELAAYFDVAGGVLVVDVAPRTPASLAGIAPGDVITHVHQVRVRSVDDLRIGVSRATDTLPISLIRRGDSVQALIRR